MIYELLLYALVWGLFSCWVFVLILNHPEANDDLTIVFTKCVLFPIIVVRYVFVTIYSIVSVLLYWVFRTVPKTLKDILINGY